MQAPQVIAILLLSALAGCATTPPLIQGILDKDNAKIDQVLAGSNLNLEKERHGFTPLAYAVAHSDLATMKKLLAKGAKPQSGLWGTIPELFAVKAEPDATKLDFLLKRGAKIDAGPYLYNAAYRGNTKAVRLFLERGANVDRAGSNGWTPLVIAARYSHAEICTLLIARGANVDGAIARLESIIAEGLQQKPSKYASVRKIISDRVAGAKAGIRLVQRLSQDKSALYAAAHPASPVDPAEEKAFAAEAKRYRALAVKPTLPQEARRFKVQAEAAVRDKRFDRAVKRYAQALTIVPWWPEGHFNRALILGEMRLFAEAIREMKRYLALMPNAADAQKAQDKIYEWEDK